MNPLQGPWLTTLLSDLLVEILLTPPSNLTAHIAPSWPNHFPSGMEASGCGGRRFRRYQVRELVAWGAANREVNYSTREKTGTDLRRLVLESWSSGSTYREVMAEQYNLDLKPSLLFQTRLTIVARRISGLCRSPTAVTCGPIGSAENQRVRTKDTNNSSGNNFYLYWLFKEIAIAQRSKSLPNLEAELHSCCGAVCGPSGELIPAVICSFSWCPLSNTVGLRQHRWDNVLLLRAMTVLIFLFSLHPHLFALMRRNVFNNVNILSRLTIAYCD